MRALLDAPETIPAGHGRYFFKCSGTPHSEYPNNGFHPAVPCPPVWMTLPEHRTRDHRGILRCDPRPVDPPRRCACGSWLRLVHRLEVDAYANECRQEGRTRHTCENTCQVSESKKCRCACGGRRHGEALRDPW